MTVGISDTDDALTLNRLVGDVVDDVVRVVPKLVLTPIIELEVDEVLVGITIVTTVLI